MDTISYGSGLEVSVLEWDLEDVGIWLERIQLGQYSSAFQRNDIVGEVLVHLDNEALKDLGIQSVGQRLSLLKEIYSLKVAFAVPMAAEHYVPPSAMLGDDVPSSEKDMSSEVNHPSWHRILQALQEKDERLQNLEREIEQISQLLQIRSDTTSRERDVASTSLMNRGDTIKSKARSPSQLESSARETGTNPGGLTIDTVRAQESFRAGTGSVDQKKIKSKTSDNILSVSSIPMGGPGSSLVRSDTEIIKNYKIASDDPCYKVLAATLKKCKSDEDWRHWAFFICWANQERCLSYDEKPLLINQKLREAGYKPVFRMRHISQMKFPAQSQDSASMHVKRSRRDETNGLDFGLRRNGSGGATTLKRGDSLRATREKTANPLSSAGWSVATLSSNGASSSPAAGRGPLSGLQHAGTRDDVPDTSWVGSEPAREPSPPSQRPPVPPSKDDVSDEPSSLQPITQFSAGSGYAYAIYPYVAEKEDELTIAVGDAFVVRKKAKGWWVVSRDDGGHHVFPDDAWGRSGLDSSSSAMSKSTATATVVHHLPVLNEASGSAWVPAGCLVETVSSAFAQTRPPLDPRQSQAGVALMPYEKDGKDELAVRKDERIKIYKRYNYWVYAVRDRDGERGWLPSWYISKEGEGTV